MIDRRLQESIDRIPAVNASILASQPNRGIKDRADLERIVEAPIACGPTIPFEKTRSSSMRTRGV